MNIRVAKEEDINIIKKMEKKLIEEELKYDDKLDINYNDSCTKYINDDRSYIIVVEKDNNKLGYLYGYIYGKRGPISGKCAVLNNIYIDDKYRGNGIGSLLVDYFKNWCIEKNIDYIEVNVYYKNELAKSFYRKHTFESKIESMNCIIKK